MFFNKKPDKQALKFAEIASAVGYSGKFTEVTPDFIKFTGPVPSQEQAEAAIKMTGTLDGKSSSIGVLNGVPLSIATYISNSPAEALQYTPHAAQFRETEYKYLADDIDFTGFLQHIEDVFEFNRTLVVAGYDAYYSKPTGEYLRHRYNSDHAELTVKRRLSESSTAERVEVDLKLGTDQEAAVAALAEILGYDKDRRIYKVCHIYWADTFNVVYYIIYDQGMNELARRVEIEANKDTANPVDAIDYAEYVLGKKYPQIGPDKRLNKTMFEEFTIRGGINESLSSHLRLGR